MKYLDLYLPAHGGGNVVGVLAALALSGCGGTSRPARAQPTASSVAPSSAAPDLPKVIDDLGKVCVP
jgi:hypothetical protein